MVNGPLHNASPVFHAPKVFYNTSQHSPIHTHIVKLTAGGFSTQCQPAHQELTHTQEQFRVQYLPQEHFNMHTGKAVDRINKPSDEWTTHFRSSGTTVKQWKKKILQTAQFNLIQSYCL